MTVRLARRWALLLVASALAVGPLVVAPSASAASDLKLGCTSGAACVDITFPDGGYPAAKVSAATIAKDPELVGQAYDYRYATGASGTDLITGITLPTLLSSIGVPVGDVTFTQARNPNNGYESPLGAGDLDDPAPFAGGLEPAFGVSGTGDTRQLEYIRPQRNSSDVNAPDRFIAGTADPVIELQVYTSDARPLHPTVTVGTGSQRVGKPVTFSASFAPDDPPHDGVTFAWTFARGDPSTAGGQTTTNTYAAGGTYEASVAVSGTGPDGEAYAGQSPEVTVSVRGKKSTPVVTPSGGNGSGGKHHPTTGPNRSHRAHHAGSAPSGGPVAVPPAAGASAAPGPTGTGGPTAAGPSTPAPTAGTSDPATNPATNTATNPATPGSGADGVLVQGVLINGSVAPAGGAVASSATRVALSARRPARLTSSFDVRWLWFLAPILLLVLGALGERRRVPHRHGPQSRL